MPFKISGFYDDDSTTFARLENALNGLRIFSLSQSFQVSPKRLLTIIFKLFNTVFLRDFDVKSFCYTNVTVVLT